MAFAERTGPNSWRVRYWTDAGVHGSITGFTTESDAKAKATEIDADKRRGTFLDPAAGDIALTDWAARWFDALDVAPATEAQYRSLADNHILARWGTTPIAELTGTDIHIWASKLRRGGYADSTVVTIVKVLSMMLADAAAERLLPANPIRPQRRGRRHHTRRREILERRMPAGRKMLKVLQNTCVGPKAANNPHAASAQAVASHRDRGRPGIGDEMLELARKVGSHHFLRRQQGEDGQKNDATPCEEAQRCSEDAGAGHNCSSIGRSDILDGIANPLCSHGLSGSLGWRRRPRLVWHRTADLGRSFVLAQPLVDHLAQQIIVRPG